MSNEQINGHPVRCYDDGNTNTADRYAIVFMDWPERDGLFMSVGFSGHSSARIGI